MKEIKQTNFLRYIAGVVILLALLVTVGIYFGYGDVSKASAVDGNESFWTVNEVTYDPNIDGLYLSYAFVSVTFHNNKLIDDKEKEEIVKCEIFDFDLRPVIGPYSSRDIDSVDIPFGSSYVMDFKLRSVPPDEETSIKLSAKGYDEDGYMHRITETITIPIEAVGGEPPVEPSPGFMPMFAIVSILLIAYVMKRK